LQQHTLVRVNDTVLECNHGSKVVGPVDKSIVCENIIPMLNEYANLFPMRFNGKTREAQVADA
jgi:hypothetical protein